jgi:membrane peptidoglycan carboxypeptidase
MAKQASGLSTTIRSWLGLGAASAIAGLLVAVMLTPVMAIAGVTVKNTIGVFDAIPDFIELDQLAQKNEIYVQNDSNPENGYKKIAEVYWQNRQEVEWKDVSQFLKDAAVAGEDRRFYEHRGVDIQGIVRAAVGNVTSGGITSGASTLTMQVIKNTYVQRAEALPTQEERDAAYAEATATSFERKFKEMKMALSLEKDYSKEQILLAYLNISNFGGNNYGVEAAAQMYFGKSAKDVTLAEAASLIAIVQYPESRNLSDPKFYSKNQARRDVVLQAMYDEGYVSKAQFTEAMNTAVDEDFVTLKTPLSGCIAADTYAKWFCDYVVKNITNFEALGETKEQRLTNWYVGGYKLYTTLNYALQVTAQDQAWTVPNNVDTPKLGAATVSVEVGTGRVLAMAQNKIFNDTQQGAGIESTAVNFSTDRAYGGSSGFQTGSTYKIFALVAWLQAGHGLNELVDASEFEKDMAKYLDTCENSGPHGGKWEFKNDAKAPPVVTVMDAVRASINSAFASIAEQLDQCNIKKAAESLGVHRADGGVLKSVPSAVLGVNELAPLSMATGFAALSNNGKACQPIVLDFAIDPRGKKLDGQKPKCTQGVDPDVAHGAVYAMKPVMSGGTGSASNPRDGVPIFGKTGTTDSSNQTWIVTSTSRVASVAWVGNIVGKYPMRSFPGGATFRHKIMSNVMRAANVQYPGGTDWVRPPERMLAGSGTEVPALRGLTVEAATTLLKGLGFEVAVGGTVQSELDNGLVVQSDPAEGSKLASGMTITLFPSDQIALLEMPNLVVPTTTQADAEARLTALGATSIRIRCQQAADPDDPLIGTVVSQFPAAGTRQSLSRSIRVTILNASCS